MNNFNPFEKFVGQSWKAVEQEVRKSHEGGIRVYDSNSMITADWRPSRLNVVLDSVDHDTIIQIHFG